LLGKDHLAIHVPNFILEHMFVSRVKSKMVEIYPFAAKDIDTGQLEN
jgi:hypothetical protein